MRDTSTRGKGFPFSLPSITGDWAMFFLFDWQLTQSGNCTKGQTISDNLGVERLVI